MKEVNYSKTITKYMIMKKLLFTALFAFIAVPLFAQGWGAAVGRGLDMAVAENWFSRGSANLDEVEGNPFYNKKWKKGQLISKTGEVSNLYYLKYLILTNKLLLQQNGGVYIAKPEAVKGFTLFQKGKKVLFKKGFSSKEYDIQPSKYLKIIYNGKIKLLANYKIDKRIQTELMTGIKTLHLSTEKQYYLVTPDGAFHAVDLEKDDILKALPGANAKLKELADKFSLDYSNEKHLQKILSICEQLKAKEGKR